MNEQSKRACLIIVLHTDSDLNAIDIYTSICILAHISSVEKMYTTQMERNTGITSAYSNPWLKCLPLRGDGEKTSRNLLVAKRHFTLNPYWVRVISISVWKCTFVMHLSEKGHQQWCCMPSYTEWSWSTSVNVVGGHIACVAGWESVSIDCDNRNICSSKGCWSDKKEIPAQWASSLSAKRHNCMNEQPNER